MSWLNHPETFRKNLLDWYDRHQRALPWRTNPTVYKTVVSELMLQQTQVNTVLPYFEKWIKTFPSFEALAASEEEQVLKHWEGLGYYNRARNLRRIAQMIVQQGSVPQNLIDWGKLPGVGPYTAAAITSIAQNQPHAVIDGNVVRVISRLTADARSFGTAVFAQRVLADVAKQLLDPTRPGDYNQAIMELGATVCTQKSPSCDQCPVQVHCEAYRLGNPTDFPNIPKKMIIKRTVQRMICLHNGRILLQKIPQEAKRLANLYEIPPLTTQEPLPSSAIPILVKKRGIASEAIEEEFYSVVFNQLPEAMPVSFKWMAAQEIDQIPLSGPHRKWLPQLIHRLNHFAAE